MARTRTDLDFSYEGMPVGYFEEECFPTVQGRYHYMPFLGPGHYEMQTSAGRMVFGKYE